MTTDIGIQIKALREQGKTYSEIRMALGCANSTIAYHLNPETRAKSAIRSKDWKASNLRKVNDLKESQPCADCGEFFEGYLMDFDHLPESMKVGNISYLLRRWGWTRLETELKKCEVVCCMCHRKRTKQRWLDNPLQTG